METQLPLCFFCGQYKSASLMILCDCQEKQFHEECGKQYIKKEIENNRDDVKKQQTYSYLPCKQCSYQIRFNFKAKARLKKCQQISLYSKQNKLLIIGIIITSILLCTCIINILFVSFKIIPINNDHLERSIIIIALAVFAGLLLIVLFFCCFDMLKTQDITIEQLKNRQSRSHRSSRSKRSKASRASNRSRSPRQFKNAQVFPQQVLVMSLQ